MNDVIFAEFLNSWFYARNEALQMWFYNLNSTKYFRILRKAIKNQRLELQAITKNKPSLTGKISQQM